MQDGSAVASSAAGQGNAGSVTIEAHDLAIFQALMPMVFSPVYRVMWVRVHKEMEEM